MHTTMSTPPLILFFIMFFFFFIHHPTSAPPSKNAVSAFQISCKLLSCTLEDSWRTDDQCSSITKGSIYFMKRTYIQPATTVVDWPEIWCLMELSTMFYILQILRFYLVGHTLYPRPIFIMDNLFVSVGNYKLKEYLDLYNERKKYWSM